MIIYYMRGRTKIILFTAAALAWAALFYYGFWRYHDSPMFDFIPSYVAAKMIGDEKLVVSIYDRHPEHFNQVRKGPFVQVAKKAGFDAPPTPYVYPPFYAWLMKPLAALPFYKAKVMMIIFSLLFFMAGLMLAFNESGRGLKAEYFYPAAPLLLLFFTPLSYNNHLGQIGTVVFTLIILSLVLANRGREIPAGILLGICAAVKFIPAVILILFLARRRYKPVLAAFFTFIFLFLLSALLSGHEVLYKYMGTVSEISAKGSVAAWNNQSVTGLLLRFTNVGYLIFQWRFIQPDLWIGLVEKALFLGLLVWAVIVIYRNSAGMNKQDKETAERPENMNLLYAGGMLLALLCTPITWNHYHIFAILPLLLTASMIREKRDVINVYLWSALWIFSLVLISIDPEYMAGTLFPAERMAGNGGFTSLPVSLNLYGIILLFVVLQLLAGRGGQKELPEKGEPAL